MSHVIVADRVGRILEGEPGTVLVEDASVAIEAGTFAAITGPSGCGKSSLLYLLGLLDRPTSGSIRIDGIDMETLDGDARARIRLERFGFVFQFHFLLPEFTVLDNVVIPMLRLGELSRDEARERAFGLLDRFGVAAKAERTPDRISGGERQRVAIARALANDPALLLADEPTGNLDSHNSAAVVAHFRALAHDEGRAVVCVTHDPDIAALADLRITMLDGRIVSH